MTVSEHVPDGLRVTSSLGERSAVEFLCLRCAGARVVGQLDPDGWEVTGKTVFARHELGVCRADAYGCEACGAPIAPAKRREPAGDPSYRPERLAGGGWNQ